MAITFSDGFDHYAPPRAFAVPKPAGGRNLDALFALAEAAGCRLAVASLDAFVDLDPDLQFQMLGPGETPTRRRGVRWTIYELVGSEWRGRSA